MFLKVLVTAAAVTTLALAQGGGDMGGMGSARPQKESKADQIAGKLKLSKDQKTEFESILEVSYQDAAQVRSQFGQRSEEHTS